MNYQFHDGNKIIAIYPSTRKVKLGFKAIITTVEPTNWATVYRQRFTSECVYVDRESALAHAEKHARFAVQTGYVTGAMGF